MGCLVFKCISAEELMGVKSSRIYSYVPANSPLLSDKSDRTKTPMLPPRYLLVRHSQAKEIWLNLDY